MPPMTMMFRDSDPALLDAVKPGDKVLFAVEKVGGQLTVTRIEAAK
jgi:Cu(I)/Ag(I) efflux system protein CusF